nr:RT0821/Lpp0805 family surface protein [Mesorhizobium sp.]
MGLSKVETDPTILTSSVDASYEALKTSQTISDQVTIRNAVSSANLEELGGKPLAWANAETRSRGAISEVVEVRKKDVLCRRFRTSRESFDGVSVYSGEACLGRDGAWYMRAFSQS